MIRILIRSTSPLTLAGIEKLLAGQRDFVVRAGEFPDGGSRRMETRDEEADVIIRESAGDEEEQAEVPRGGDGGAVVVLADTVTPASVGRILASGAAAVLPKSVSAEELAATVRAAAAGLVVLHQDAAAAVAGTVPLRQNEVAEPLTPREREVLAGMAEGRSNKEIAALLNISDHTVKFHVAAIMGKLGASSRTEAVTLAIRNGILMV